VTRDVCKLFTNVCPHCVVVQSCRKPTAGIKPILTSGMGVRGQVDLIDFQSMPDGVFHYLLNYIDHGVKMLISIPLASKRAASVAFALFTIFTEIGPPRILQTNNGGNSQIMHMIMLGVHCCLTTSSLTTSSRNSRTYGLNARWSAAHQDTPSPMEVWRG
jgi:hypothetical protein